MIAGAICAALAALWIGGGVIYVFESLGFVSFFRLLPHEFATIVLALLVPPALLALLAAPYWLERAPAAGPHAGPDAESLRTQIRALSETAHAAQERIGATLRDMDVRVDRLHRAVAGLAKPAAGLDASAAALGAAAGKFDSGIARVAGFDATGAALAQRIETLTATLGRIDTLARELARAGDAARETARQMEAASSALETARQRIGTAGEAAGERVERSAQALEERGQTTAAVGNAVAARLINAERRLADLEQSLARQMGALDSLAERVRDTAGSLAAEAERLRVGGVRVDPLRRTV
jgi:chromosome segregation ATPase